jgi:DmsE family decaheme c-type cytochrome
VRSGEAGRGHGRRARSADGARLALLLAVGAALGACATLAWKPSGPRRVAPITGAEPIGAAECTPCHEDVQGHERIAAYHADCEACHGGGSLHAESEAVADIRHPSNGDCLACHAPGRDTHLAWGTGEHSRAGLLCSDCHNPHATTRHHLRSAERVALAPDSAAPGASFWDATSRLCVDCHDDVGARFHLPSRHPVREGMMSCTSCHDPHEDSRVTLGERNARCFACHQDYAGPWIYEHQPVVEDCTQCHDPHGAPAQALLETPQPVICIECHSLADLWHHNTGSTGVPGSTPITEDRPPAGSSQAIKLLSARTFLRDCTNCHGAVHGSYSDPTLQH